MTSRVLFFDGDTPNTFNRFPQLLNALGLEWDVLPTEASFDEMLRAVGRHPLLLPVFCVAPGRFSHGAYVLGENFVHPEHALYVFGPDHETLTPPDIGQVLTVPTTLERRSLFADQAAAMVLWDRHAQLGRYR